MSALEFPILTFDERRLSPAFGYVFHRRWLDPYESIVSILWKFAKMNALPGYVIAAQVAADHVDPYEGINPLRSEMDFPRLRQMLKLPSKSLLLAVIPASRAELTSPYFRYCRRCLSHGYHSVVHQLLGVSYCPIHRYALAIECRGCGHRAAYRLNASILDAPHRCPRCRCGYGGSPVGSIEGRSKLPAGTRGAIGRAHSRHLPTSEPQLPSVVNLSPLRTGPVETFASQTIIH